MTGMSLQDLIAANASARLNKLAGFEVTAAADGAAEIVLIWHGRQSAAVLSLVATGDTLMVPASKAI